MKTERRHELKHNELADFMGRAVERMKPYATGILGGLLALVVLVGVYVYLSNSSEARRRDAFDTYFDAAGSPQGLAKLDELAQQYPDDPAGIMAQLTASDRRLIQGTNNLFADRAAARDELRKSLTGYKAVRAHTSDPFLLQMAVWGQAKAYESLGYESPDDIKKAIALYTQLAESDPNGPLAKEAVRRAADLQRNSTLEFYDWFARSNPPPPATEQPLSLDPGSLDDLPEGPEIEPGGSLLESDLPAEAPPEQAPPTETAPPTESTPPADIAPAPSEPPAPTEPAPTEPAPTEPAPTGTP